MYIFTEHDKIQNLQQKGLEDYKLATANASMSADFSMEKQTNDLHHGFASLSLEAGVMSSTKQQKQNIIKKKAEKPQSAIKEV